MTRGPTPRLVVFWPKLPYVSASAELKRKTETGRDVELRPPSTPGQTRGDKKTSRLESQSGEEGGNVLESARGRTTPRTRDQPMGRPRARILQAALKVGSRVGGPRGGFCPWGGGRDGPAAPGGAEESKAVGGLRAHSACGLSQPDPPQAGVASPSVGSGPPRKSPVLVPTTKREAKDSSVP